MPSQTITTARPLNIIRNFSSTFEEIWQEQRQLQQDLIAGHGSDTLIHCVHEPVLTVGRGSDRQHILSTQDEMNGAGIKLLEIERGGQVTYHGPGQLVFYPIINLSYHRRDVGWYMRTLEQVIINTLASYNIQSLRIAGKTGVWVESNGEQYKIASIGVRISRWCTLHGFAINVSKQSLHGFQYINPCGLVGAKVTCIEDQSKNFASIEKIGESIEQNFVQEFRYQSHRV